MGKVAAARSAAIARDRQVAHGPKPMTTELASAAHSLELDTFGVSKDWVVTDMFDYRAGRTAMQLLGITREHANVRMIQLQSEREKEARSATAKLQGLAAKIGHSREESEPSDIAAEIFVPAFPINNGGVARVELQLCRRGESTLIIGFTSLALLVERMGDYQPWIMAPMRELLALVSKYDVDGMVVDPVEGVVSVDWNMSSLESLNKVNNVRF